LFYRFHFSYRNIRKYVLIIIVRWIMEMEKLLVLAFVLLAFVVKLLTFLLAFMVEHPLITIAILSCLIQIISLLWIGFSDSDESSNTATTCCYSYLLHRKEVYNWERVLALLLTPVIIPLSTLVFLVKNSFLWLFEKNNL